jgi:transcription elongation factor Elf1
MDTEKFDGLEWEIGSPIGSSTPDDQFEVTYAATATCPNCGSKIEGEASYWSDNEDMSNAWFNNVQYEPCECAEEDDEYEEDEL